MMQSDTAYSNSYIEVLLVVITKPGKLNPEFAIFLSAKSENARIFHWSIIIIMSSWHVHPPMKNSGIFGQM